MIRWNRRLPSHLLADGESKRLLSACSALEAELAQQISLCGLPAPEREYRFDLSRRWRADFAWPIDRLLVEVEGGIHTSGRHIRAKGFEEDSQKYNTATAMGWRLLRVTGAQIRNGQAVKWIEECLETEAGNTRIGLGSESEA